MGLQTSLILGIVLLALLLIVIYKSRKFFKNNTKTSQNEVDTVVEAEKGNYKILVTMCTFGDVHSIDNIDNIIRKAKRPKLLSFGILHPYADKGDCGFSDKLYKIAYKYGLSPSQLKCIELDISSLSFPICLPGAMITAAKSSKGEPLILQLGAKVILEENWDHNLTEEWKSCNDENAILTGALPSKYDKLVITSKIKTNYLLFKGFERKTNTPVFSDTECVFNPRDPLPVTIVSTDLLFSRNKNDITNAWDSNFVWYAQSNAEKILASSSCSFMLSQRLYNSSKKFYATHHESRYRTSERWECLTKNNKNQAKWRESSVQLLYDNTKKYSAFCGIDIINQSKTDNAACGLTDSPSLDEKHSKCGEDSPELFL